MKEYNKINLPNFIQLYLESYYLNVEESKQYTHYIGSWVDNIGGTIQSQYEILTEGLYYDIEKWFLQDGCKNEEIIINYYKEPRKTSYKLLKVFNGKEIPDDILKLVEEVYRTNNEVSSLIDIIVNGDSRLTYKYGLIHEGSDNYKYHKMIKWFIDQGCRNESVVVYYN